MSNPTDDLKIAVIGGSGLGEAFDADATAEHFPDTPFGKPSAPILETTIKNTPVLLLRRHGVGHTLNPSAVPYRANLFALKQLGATHVLASGAVGSLREDLKPRDLVVVDQVIDKTSKRPATFYEHAAVHVAFSDPFCPILRKLLRDAATDGVTTHDRGTYVCMEGPAFSSRAESHMHRLWGGDLIGMTLMPEAKLAREAELPYAAVCLVTDYDCWRDRPADAPIDADELLMEIIGHLKKATANAMGLIHKAIAMAPSRLDELMTCPAREALKLGIWSDKSKLDAGEVERLAPLWGRHFES